MRRKPSKGSWFVAAATRDPDTGKRTSRFEPIQDEKGEMILFRGAKARDEAERCAQTLEASGYVAYAERWD